jgi:hypothetical protein
MVSVVVVFSLALSSCGGNKNNVSETKVPDIVARTVRPIYTANNVKTVESEGDVMKAGENLSLNRYSGCSYDNKTDESVCKDKVDNSTIRIAEVIYESKSYEGKEDLQCILANEGERCDPPPVKCVPQDGSEECKPKDIYVNDAKQKMERKIEEIENEINGQCGTDDKCKNDNKIRGLLNEVIKKPIKKKEVSNKIKAIITEINKEKEKKEEEKAKEEADAEQKEKERVETERKKKEDEDVRLQEEERKKEEGKKEAEEATKKAKAEEEEKKKKGEEEKKGNESNEQCDAYEECKTIL